MKIKDLPWYNRPGFKLTKNGVGSMDNTELLSIIFWDNDDEDDSLEISNKVLKKYNLHKIEDAGYNELVSLICDKKRAKHKDFMKAMKLLSFVELAKRYGKLTKGGYNKKAITSAKDVFNMFCDRFSNEKKENFIVLYLDTKNKVIKEELISVGTLNSCLAHPREVFKSDNCFG